MKKLTFTTATLALAAVPAFAAITIQDLDASGDSFATFEEVRNAIPRMDITHFNSIDSNNDGRLSAEEVSDSDAQAVFAQHAPLSGKYRALSLLDPDGDGFISWDYMRRVYPTMTMTTFDQIDLNKDHRLSYEEYYSPEAQTAIAQCAKPEFMDLADMDINGDRYLSLDELQIGYPSAGNREFDLIDLNKDNRISSVELLSPAAECLSK